MYTPRRALDRSWPSPAWAVEGTGGGVARGSRMQPWSGEPPDQVWTQRSPRGLVASDARGPHRQANRPRGQKLLPDYLVNLMGTWQTLQLEGAHFLELEVP
jgi:hypothetical protein